jgi:uncharacterized membrane protein required for colicin V production
MTIYDAAMAVVLIGGMIRGAWRGITWQLASIGSLVLGYLFAYPISAQIAPLLPGPAETTRALSMAVAYAVVSSGVFAAAWMVRGAIHKLKFDAFDRHLGMMLGGVEGAGVGILLTLLVVSVSPNTREPIFASPSGRVVGTIMNTLGPVLPGEVRRILQPFWGAADGPGSESIVLGTVIPAPEPKPLDSSPAPVVAASVVQPVRPVASRDAAVRPAADPGDEDIALEAPAQPAAPAGPRSMFDSIVDQGKQAVEQVVVESLDTDPDQKASTLRQLVDRDKKRIQNAVSDAVGGVKQNLTKQAQGRAGQVQGRVNQVQGQAVKARQKLEQKIGDTIDQQLDRLGGLQPAPEKQPR